MTRRWIVHAMSKPGAAALRATLEASHSAYLAEVRPFDILVGAPLLTQEGGPVFGDFFLVAATSRQAVERFVAQLPFRTAGL